MAVVALACGQEIGVDVEQICDPVPDPAAIRPHCSPRELAGMGNPREAGTWLLHSTGFGPVKKPC